MSWNFELAAGPYNCALVGIAPQGEDVVFAATADSKLYRIAPGAAAQESRRFTSRTSGLAEGPHGLLYGCQEASRRVCEFQPDGSNQVTAVTIDGLHHNHPSDAVVDRTGRVWFCDPHNALPAFGPQMYPPLGWAAVLRAERGPNHRWGLVRVTYDTRHPRAIALSPDDKTLYVAEGGAGPEDRRELRAYPLTTDGTLGQPRVLMTFGADAAGPHRGIEGLCVDSEGFVIAVGGSARSGPGAMAYVFAPDGAIVEGHRIPDDMPMRCAFAGPGRSTLYISTAGGRLWRVSNTGRSGLRRFG